MSLYKTFNFQPDPIFLKIGIVKSLDNSNDKNRKDRILVSFLNEESECYASMMYNYFGEKFGGLWYPDPGTIVVVAFIDNCLDGAVIIGCLNKYEEDLLPLTKENEKQFIKHKNGTTIEFLNKENESKISISTKDEKEKLIIDLNNENIQINNQSETLKFFFDFKESKVNLKSKELVVELEENMSIKCKNVNFELQDKFIVKGSGMSLETNGEMSMKSKGNVKIESSTGTDIKSSGIININ